MKWFRSLKAIALGPLWRWHLGFNSIKCLQNLYYYKSNWISYFELLSAYARKYKTYWLSSLLCFFFWPGPCILITVKLPIYVMKAKYVCPTFCNTGIHSCSSQGPPQNHEGRALGPPPAPPCTAPPRCHASLHLWAVHGQRRTGSPNTACLACLNPTPLPHHQRGTRHLPQRGRKGS